MRRKHIGNGTWFDADAAKNFEEDTRRNCQDQWSHEGLWRTKGGAWVRSSWSDWQGSGPVRYTIISTEAAARWLVKNKYTETDLGALWPGAEIAALELK